MSDTVNEIPESPDFQEEVPEKKKDKTLWIILAVAAGVILLCCCAIAVGALFLIPSAEYDQLFFDLYPLIPMI